MRLLIKLIYSCLLPIVIYGCDNGEAEAIKTENRDSYATLEAPLSKIESESVKIMDRAMKKHMEDDYVTAGKLYLEAISLNKKNRLAYANYSQMYCRKGDIKKAFDILYNAGKYINFTHTDLFILGIYSDLLDKHDRAERFYKESINRTPDDVNKAWAMHFIDTGMGKKALDEIVPIESNEILLETLKEFPPGVMVRNYLHDACGNSKENKYNN